MDKAIMGKIKIIAGVALVSLILSGCITTKDNTLITMQKLSKEGLEAEKLIQERDKIFKVYDDFIPTTIILAYEKVYGDTFSIAKNYLQYNKTTDDPTYDGFWIWLMKNLWYKDMFDKGDEFGIGKRLIDNRFNDKEYNELLKNYELLKKMNEK